MQKITVPATIVCNGADIEVEMTVYYDNFEKIVVDRAEINGNDIELNQLGLEQLALEIEELL